MKAAATQLAFDWEPEIEPAAPIAEDRVADALIAAGYGNAYLLSIDRSIGGWSVDAPAPSRLYLFPLEFASRERYGGEQSRLLLHHPDIGGLTFVQQVARETGIIPVWDAEDEFGRDRGAKWRYFHAVDLMTAKHWQHLMATRHLTDHAAITCAVARSLGYSKKTFTTAIAREVLGIIGADEPADRSHKALMSRKAVMGSKIVEKYGKRESARYPINLMARGAAGAWIMVHGIEDGWFKRGRDGFLGMSPEGLERRGEAS